MLNQTGDGYRCDASASHLGITDGDPTYVVESKAVLIARLIVTLRVRNTPRKDAVV